MTEEKIDDLGEGLLARSAGMVSPVIIDRLAELRRHLDHLHKLRPRVTDPEILAGDFSLSNDVLYSLQVVCRVVINVASEFSVRDGRRFQDYTEAIRNLAPYSRNTTLCRASQPRKAGLPGAKEGASPAFWASTVKRSPWRSRTIHSVLAPW